jgi:hypothetical protein
MAFNVVADGDDASERGQVWAAESWETYYCMVLAPCCVYAVERQRNEDEADEGIHDFE